MAQPTQTRCRQPQGEPLLVVSGLDVTYRTPEGSLPAVKDVGFTVHQGEVLGLVGESGSGKSTVLTALLRMLPKAATMSATKMSFAGQDLTRLSAGEMRKLRGSRLSLIPQRPMTSLSPVTPVRTQIKRLVGPELTDERLAQMMDMVGLGGVKDRLDDYPFAFSGGQLQRVLIATAMLAREPEFVLADEPTTTLDATVQAQILNLMLDLRDRLGNSMIFVSHDLAVVSQVCDRVGVMYGGRLVELVDTEQLFTAPQHPYTRALLDAMPARHERGERLRSIKGSVSGSQRLPGCPFAPRCPHATQVCDDEVPLPRQVVASVVRCHHAGGLS